MAQTLRIMLFTYLFTFVTFFTCHVRESSIFISEESVSVLVCVLGNTHYILWSMKPDRGLSSMSEEKKIKIKSHKLDFFILSDIFWRISRIFWQKYYRFGKKKFSSFWHVGEKNKINTRMPVFFLVGDILSLSEGSWTKEYSECCLSYSVTASPAQTVGHMTLIPQFGS